MICQAAKVQIDSDVWLCECGEKNLNTQPSCALCYRINKSPNKRAALPTSITRCECVCF